MKCIPLTYSRKKNGMGAGIQRQRLECEGGKQTENFRCCFIKKIMLCPSKTQWIWSRGQCAVCHVALACQNILQCQMADLWFVYSFWRNNFKKRRWKYEKARDANYNALRPRLKHQILFYTWYFVVRCIFCIATHIFSTHHCFGHDINNSKSFIYHDLSPL